MKENIMRNTKTVARLGLLCVVYAAFLPALQAQGFDAGSDGTLGDVIVAENTTLDLPADGRLHYKSLTVNSGVRLNFRRNANNTPVFILSQGDVIVNGTIDVNGFAAGNSLNGGAGGPGGFDGGKPGFGEAQPGFGYGPGGGNSGTGDCSGPGAGGGGYGLRAVNISGPTYGSHLLVPLIGGSGGGGTIGQPGLGGGGGGGAIMIAANTRIFVTGVVEARGGTQSACVNAGSGGAIRLVAPKVEGTGNIDVRSIGNGGQGRIRVDTIDRSNLRFTFQDPAVTSVGGNLFTFPAVIPRLDTIEVAGQAVPLGSGPLTFTLPFGSTPERTIKVRASGFGRVVPIQITLTPDSGNPVKVDSQIDNSGETPAVVEVPVTLPVNTLVTVHCWTR
jgi:hypothetical protein